MREASRTAEARAAAMATAPSASRSTRSPGAMIAPPTVTGALIAPTLVLVAPLTRIQRVQTGKPSARISSVSRTAASTRMPATWRNSACVASSSPISATGSGSGIVKTRTSPGWTCSSTACTIKLSPWPQRTVRAGPTTLLPGMSCTRGISMSPVRPAAS